MVTGLPMVDVVKDAENAIDAYYVQSSAYLRFVEPVVLAR